VSSLWVLSLPVSKQADTPVSNPENWLYSLICSNKPLLMEHEQALLRGIGVASRDSLDEITCYVETGRVSVLFVATTTSLDDTMVVAIIAPPDDRMKRMRVVEWVKSEPARYHRVRSELLAEGYQVSLIEMEA